jgi:hypothetical protein
MAWRSRVGSKHSGLGHPTDQRIRNSRSYASYGRPNASGVDHPFLSLRPRARQLRFTPYFYEYESSANSVNVSRGTFQSHRGRAMQTGTRTTATHPTGFNPRGTHVSKPPRSNRQNLARLEIVVTLTKQSPNPKSNRQFFRPFAPLPWTQLQHEASQLKLTGHFRPLPAPRPPTQTPRFLITASAIRNRRISHKTNNGGHF